MSPSSPNNLRRKATAGVVAVRFFTASSANNAYALSKPSRLAPVCSPTAFRPTGLEITNELYTSPTPGGKVGAG